MHSEKVFEQWIQEKKTHRHMQNQTNPKETPQHNNRAMYNEKEKNTDTNEFGRKCKWGENLRLSPWSLCGFEYMVGIYGYEIIYSLR